MPFYDPYRSQSAELSTSAHNAFEIVPHPTNDIECGIKALKVVNKTADWLTVRVLTMRDDEVDIDVPPSAVWLDPIRVRKVLSTTPAYVAGGTMRIFGYTDAEGDE